MTLSETFLLLMVYTAGLMPAFHIVNEGDPLRERWRMPERLNGLPGVNTSYDSLLKAILKFRKAYLRICLFCFYQNLPRTPSVNNINYMHTYLKNIFHRGVPTYQHTNKIFIFQHTMQRIILYINYLDKNINIIYLCWYVGILLVCVGILFRVCWYVFLLNLCLLAVLV